MEDAGLESRLRNATDVEAEVGWLESAWGGAAHAPAGPPPRRWASRRSCRLQPTPAPHPARRAVHRHPDRGPEAAEQGADHLSAGQRARHRQSGCVGRGQGTAGCWTARSECRARPGCADATTAPPTPSLPVARELTKRGFSKVFLVAGGSEAWAAAKLRIRPWRPAGLLMAPAEQKAQEVDAVEVAM